MTTSSEAPEIYCLKCKAKTGSKNVQAVTLKNGRPATSAICIDCGTSTVSRWSCRYWKVTSNSGFPRKRE